jgi:phage gp36-like protein
MTMRAVKQPSAAQLFTYDFSSDLGSGVGAPTIANVVGAPTSEARGTGANLTIVGSPDVGPSTVAVRWEGGEDGESYLTTVKVLDTAGNEHEREGQIDVVEVGFPLPEDLSSRYLTAEEYVERYGLAETVRLTDEKRLNVVDGPKLESAIKDATDIADSYIGTRYTTPLLGVPRIIKTIVATLAREILHKSKPTPEVLAAADRARTMLRDIAAGRMTLPVESGDAVPVIGGNLYALSSGDSSTTFRDAVSGFSLDSAWPIPNWRR